MKRWKCRAAGLFSAFLLCAHTGASALGAGISVTEISGPPPEAVPADNTACSGCWSFARILRTAFGKAVYRVDRELASPDGSMTWPQYLELVRRIYAARQEAVSLADADGADEFDTGDDTADAGTGDETAAETVETIEAGEAQTDSPLRELGDNPEKRLLLFGDENWDRYQVYESEEDAASYMMDVEVPVWTLRKGERIRGTMTLTVHRALAEDVLEIFTEIFNDPEQFPMESMVGFRYRSGTNGEHNNGTAIDLNAEQNYQIREGVVLAGSCWEPGVNPYSIPPDGSVVRIFAAHGWSWGGGAWAESADDSTGYHDYMHFSYRGR
ncbi:MAG: M15 family metallopeptidase [Oscillibacter sp.]|nr:M15 family metallopeptidase [Oscillibacter sp.]